MTLEGFHVLVLGDEASAYGARLLADLGAAVTVVEPDEGEPLRHRSPQHPGLAPPEASLAHLYLRAGCRSVVAPPGSDAWLELLTSCDAVVDETGLGHDEVRRHNPHAVHVSVVAFGLDGPYRDWRATDIVAAAAGGFAWVCGKPGDPPNQPGAAQADKLCGLHVGAAVAAALLGRERHGRPGGHIEISRQEAAAMAVLQTSNPAIREWEGRIPARPGLTSVHKTKDDKWVTLGIRPSELDDFLRWCEEEGLEIPARSKLRVPLVNPHVGRLTRALAARYTRDGFYERAWADDLLGLPVHTVADLDEAEHLHAIGVTTHVEDEERGATLRVPASPLRGVGGSVGRAPTLGEHAGSPGAAVDGVSGDALRVPDLLHGIRVLDFCWVLAGPLGTRLLANLGADVLRVESGARGFDDQFHPDHDHIPETGAFHNLAQPNKRSLTIDPANPEGRELLLRLVEHVDVVTNNYRPGAMEAMGFDHETLAARNPRLVNIHIPGSGRSGPWRDRRSFGNMVSAAAGVSWLTGFPGRSPRGVGVAYPDFTTPYLLVMAVVAALRRRDRTGEGAEVELNQLAGLIPQIGVEYLQWSATGVDPGPCANRDPNRAPHGVYPCVGDDRWVALAVEGDAQFGAFSDVIGQPDLSLDPRFSTHADRKQHEDELDEVVCAWTSTRDRWECASALQDAGIAAYPVIDPVDAATVDPYLSTRHIRHVTQPAAPELRIPVVQESIRDAGHDRTLPPAAPWGAHDDEVLRELLGIDDDELARLRSVGAVRPPARRRPGGAAH